jgi:hypothetical protein
MIMNGEQVRICKKVVVGFLNVLSWNFCGETEENHRKPVSG